MSGYADQHPMTRPKAFASGNRIGKRLIVMIILFSSLITLVSTAVQLLVDYRQQRRDMDSVLDTAMIYVPIISDSVWALDKVQIELVLGALVQMPNIVQARVETADRKLEWSAGKDTQSANVVKRRFALYRTVRGKPSPIAVLEVVASLDAIYLNVAEHAVSILLSNALKTFVVAIFMFIVFRRIVTDRLETLAKRVIALPPLVLPLHGDAVNVEHGKRTTGDDELDAVSHAFDEMSERLRTSIQALRRSNEELVLENEERRRAEEALSQYHTRLEELVEARTAEVVEQKEYLALALNDRTQANEELHRTLEMLRDTQDELVGREKMAALGSLVAGVAHELNTPIGNSMTSASTLRELTSEMQQKLGEGLKRSTLESYLNSAGTASDILVRNLQRAAELVNGFKQVAVDQTSSQRRRFALHDVVNEIAIMLKPTLQNTPYIFDFQIAEELELDSYPGPLGQVLTNLINNAIMHGFDGRDHGTIKLQASLLENERIALTISDDGRGIPPAHLGHVFEPFFTTRMGQGGTGLGLNISHGIVTSILGGKISVSSELGQGAAFTILLPIMAPDRIN